MKLFCGVCRKLITGSYWTKHVKSSGHVALLTKKPAVQPGERA